MVSAAPRAIAPRASMISPLWPTTPRDAGAASGISALRAGQPVAGRSSPSRRCPRRAVRADLRRLDRLPGPAGRAHRQRVDPDRGAGHLGAEEARRLDDPREQHRPDHRVGRRVGRRRRRLHHPGADLPDAQRAGLLQLFPDPDARLRRRHPRRADDGAAAPRADRQGARRAALPGRRRLRRRAGRRRARRRARDDGVHRPRRRRDLEVALLDLPDLPDRPSATRWRAPASFPTRR